MAGIMDAGTRRTIENLKRLEDLGGQCAVVTPIFYAKHNTSDESIRHFEAVCDASHIDIAVYNITPFTGEKMSAAAVSKIAKFPHVRALKDSSGDFGDFQKLLREFKDNRDISVLQGTTIYAAASLLLGADGFVPSIAPLFPELFAALYDAGRAGDKERTLALDAVVADTAALLTLSRNAFAANKYGISLLGLTDKRLLAPLEPASPEEEAKIRVKTNEINAKIHELGLM
jgi:4-hydroxy-tetrahydrodipicolinate synthase